MALKIYLYGLFFLTLAFWITIGILFFTANPFKADQTTLIIFFVALFGAILTSLSLIGFYFRVIFFKNINLNIGLKCALRQGFLAAFLVVGIMVFSALNILNLWTISLYFVILILIELILKAR